MTAPRLRTFLLLVGLAWIGVTGRQGPVQAGPPLPAGNSLARPSELVITVPRVHLGRPGTERTWVSCRVPVRARVRVQASDEEKAGLDAVRAPRLVGPGEWAIWELPRDARWGESVTLRLYIDPLGRRPQGAVFVVSNGARPSAAGLKAAQGGTDFRPNPARPPRDRTGEFTFGLAQDADVTFTIQPNSPALRSPVYERLLRDLPKGQHTVRWNLKTRERAWAPSGAYIARFGATPRAGGARVAHVVVYFTIAPGVRRADGEREKGHLVLTRREPFGYTGRSGA